jgi:hypothetical protein
MSHGNSKDPAKVYQGQMNTAAAAAEPISAQEQEYNAYTGKLWDMYTGKTKFDLSKLPNANVIMPMYEQAKARSDQGRIGKGLSYSGGPGSEGYNANLVASVDQQNQDERERDAAGQVEQRVADTFSGMPGRELAMGQSDQARRDANFNRYAQMYGMEINKPQKKKWYDGLLSGSLGVLGSWAGAGFAT